jgi:type IV secretion system protein TrbB
LGGSRFAGQLPPIVAAPTFAIRKKAVAIFTLDNYVASGILRPSHRAYLRQAVLDHRNGVIVGGTGSGKTTLVNAYIDEICSQFPDERLHVLEDTGEIQCRARNHNFYHTTVTVDMATLLAINLRMYPGRLIIGEVRRAEALDLLDMWNSGHEGGVCTLHANNAYLGLRRLKSLIGRNASAPKDIEQLIAEVVHFLVHIGQTLEGRRVLEILEIQGYEDGKYITKPID